MATTADAADAVNLNKIKSFTGTIVYGYIRPMERELSFAVNIIPASIIQICLRYFAPPMAVQIFAAIQTRKKNKHGRFSRGPARYIDSLIHVDLQAKQTVEMKIPSPLKMSTLEQQVTFINHVKLSATAKAYFAAQLPQSTDMDMEWDMSESCSAMVCSSSKQIVFMKNATNLHSVAFKLPGTALPRGDVGSQCVFSEYYGLISYSKFLYDEYNLLSLPLGAPTWTTLACQARKDTGEPHTLCLIHGYKSIEDKVMTFAGSNSYCRSNADWNDYTSGTCSVRLHALQNERTVDILGFDTFHRQEFGTVYDSAHESLYVFGGNNGYGQTVNVFDFHKQTWCMTNSMVFNHSYHPIGWMDGFVLYIAGGNGNNAGTVECLDMRFDASSWMLANADMQIDKIVPPCNVKRIHGNHIWQ